ncbi:beta-ketoacyl synthase N-terminal-like domain-containing protein [Mycolicibacter sp. MYC017]|uniref:Beta-ketoacyl synthase N-terminal-like domain-containing protein n=1 Tax=[Mycobacterium] vasticus TaxID=2875777 RepID=A0ABU5Z3U0_9MYCO|nr:beta-ketoacyl synthase N-terminal-like domain-containing protein [Mycolicibacter sp. MYC017]MEB3072071.1 beta-ketoacyl synthase N-terminal-like domain-containing protein [Mycolicibacter sp. MYC017]
MSNASMSPVAVIGMACRLPGGVDSPDLLCEALLRGDDLVAPVYDIDVAVPGIAR